MGSDPGVIFLRYLPYLLMAMVWSCKTSPGDLSATLGEDEDLPETLTYLCSGEGRDMNLTQIRSSEGMKLIIEFSEQESIPARCQLQDQKWECHSLDGAIHLRAPSQEGFKGKVVVRQKILFGTMGVDERQWQCQEQL